MSTQMEYLPLIIYAVTFFIMPTVGAIVFWWFWRHQRAGVRSRYGDRMRERSASSPRNVRTTKTGEPFSILRLPSALPTLLMRRKYFDCTG